MQQLPSAKVVALATFLGGLALTGAASACPGARSEPRPSSPAVAQAASTDCPYAASQRGCCSGMSLESKLALSSTGAGLFAFALGWMTGGRRKQRSEEA